jgi:Domain of Unknown Function (DUF1080)
MNFQQLLPVSMLIATTIALAFAQTATFNFETDTAEKPPAGFTSYASGDEPAGKWLIKAMPGAPSGKLVVQQTYADATDARYPILISDKGEYGDVDVSVKAKSLSGKIDQGMGLVFRFSDPKSYYIVRANALENNFRLYRMVNGKRLQFASASTKVTPNQWHTLRVVAKGDHIVCYFDGKALIDAHDKTYTKGKVGLWTKADSIIAFDDLAVSGL